MVGLFESANQRAETFRYSNNLFKPLAENHFQLTLVRLSSSTTIGKENVGTWFEEVILEKQGKLGDFHC